MQSLSILLPAYNEAFRLPRTFDLLKLAKIQGVFSQVELREVWVIDDGSDDGTSEVALASLPILPEIKVHRVEPNQGKGNAIHTGLKLCSSDWCLIADADSATPWDQFKKLFQTAMKEERLMYPISMGSRDLPESDIQTKQSWIRENMGKTFNLIVRTITGLPFRDTQCGFKLIHLPSIRPIIDSLEVKRFAWDVEFLMFAQDRHLKIAEIPVSWAHQDASRVNPIKDSAEMLLRVLQLRFRICMKRFKSK